MSYIRIKKYILMCLICLCVLGKPVMAEERNIYIGDLITLEIEDISRETIIEAFQEFDIVEIDEIRNGYKITIRSFEPGEKNVAIGNRDITIQIASTLDDMQQDDIYEGDLAPRGGGKIIPWLYIYIGVATICAISGCIVLIRRLRHDKIRIVPPYNKFQSALESISSLSNPTVLVEMTAILKRYMEDIFHQKIIGKTSREIMVEISSIQETTPYRDHINQWLRQCDTYKFSGIQVSPEQIEQMRIDLIQIGGSIHEQEEGVVG